MTMTALDKWYGYMKSMITRRCGSAASRRVFEAHGPRRSAGDITFKYLRAPSRCWAAGLQYIVNAQRHRRGARIRNEIEGIKINGVDIITSADDRIIHFKVMVRPLKG